MVFWHTLMAKGLRHQYPSELPDGSSSLREIRMLSHTLPAWRYWRDCLKMHAVIPVVKRLLHLLLHGTAVNTVTFRCGQTTRHANQSFLSRNPALRYQPWTTTSLVLALPGGFATCHSPSLSPFMIVISPQLFNKGIKTWISTKSFFVIQQFSWVVLKSGIIWSDSS